MISEFKTLCEIAKGKSKRIAEVKIKGLLLKASEYYMGAPPKKVIRGGER